MVQNDKKLCPLHSIYQEPYTIWFSFMVHMCKIIISLGVFHFFKSLIFRLLRWVGRWGWGGGQGEGGDESTKKDQNWQKILFVALRTSGAINHLIVIYSTHASNDNIPRVFSLFSNFLFFGLLHSVHWSINPPFQKHHPVLSSQAPL